jgi:hypothetical protein
VPCSGPGFPSVAELVDAESVLPDEKVNTKFTVTLDPLPAGAVIATVAFPYGWKLPVPERLRFTLGRSPDPVTGKLRVTGTDPWPARVVARQISANTFMTSLR